MIKRNSKSFSETNLWRKINNVSRRVGMKVIYPVVLLFYLLKSSTVPWKAKSVIAGALTYFILPFDGLPDIIPFLGYADDFSLLAATVSNMIRYVSPEILELTRNKIGQIFKNKEESSKMEAEIQTRLKQLPAKKARNQEHPIDCPELE